MTRYTNIDYRLHKSVDVVIDDSEHTKVKRVGISGNFVNTTPYYFSKTTENNGVRRDTLVVKGKLWSVGYYKMPIFSDIPSSAVATCKTIAQLKVQALNGINPEKNSYGLDIAEAAQIPHLLPNLGMGIMKMVQHLKSRNGSGFLHASVNFDLAVKFGLLPTLQSISEWLNVVQPRGLNGKVVVGSASDSGSASYTKKVTNAAYANGTRHITEVLNRKVKYKYRLANRTIAALNSNGLLNVPGVVYQTVPLSFMLDWVSNVGQLVKTLGSTSGYTYLDGYGISFRKRTRYFEGRNDSRVQSIIKPKHRSIIYERSIVTDHLDASSFYFDLSNTSVGKAVTAAEILLQRVGRR